jgi:hypothetical protein
MAINKYEFKKKGLGEKYFYLFVIANEAKQSHRNSCSINTYPVQADNLIFLQLIGSFHREISKRPL